MIDLSLFLFLLQAAPRLGEQAMLSRIHDSGRLVLLGETHSERVAIRPLIPPGAAPLLAFRYFEGRDRHRFGKLDLVLDDAGH
jgi:hypothetical protein